MTDPIEEALSRLQSVPPMGAALTGARAERQSQGPATDKQLGYMRSLGLEREIGIEPEDFETMIEVWLGAGVCTKSFVSTLIEEYLTLPRRNSSKETEPGYYTKDGKYYVVVMNKAATHTYAKELIVAPNGKVSWEYKPGAVRQLGSLTPLTVEEAARWGHLHGKCIVCCRALSDPASVTNGIGPVCAKRIKK